MVIVQYKLIIRPLHLRRHFVLHIRQLVEADSLRKPLPFRLVERLVPVMDQRQTPGSVGVWHRSNLLREHLPQHREEQMEDIVVQHTVIVLPIRQQHLPQHRQHRIVRTRRDEPVPDATPLLLPGCVYWNINKSASR